MRNKKFILFKRIIWSKIIYLFLIGIIYSDVSSITGSINFDSNGDSEAEMVLNSVGLGIGVSPSTNLHVSGNGIVENGSMLIGGTSGNSTLHIHGSIGLSVETISSDTTLSANSSVLANTSSQDVSITLPYAGNVMGRIYKIKKISSLNTLSVFGNPYLDGYSKIEFTKNSDGGLPFLEMISNGSEWYLLNSSDNLNAGIASDNLIGWWKLDGTSGNTALDSSQHNHSGTLLNFNYTTGGTTGVISNALTFDGSSSHSVNMGSNSNHDVGSGNFTYSVWVKTSNSGNNMAIVTRDPDYNPYHALRQFASGKPRFQYSDSSSNSVTVDCTITINDGLWHHVVGMRDGDNGYLYVDGVQRGTASNASTGVVDNGAASFIIGARDKASGAHSFYGSVDDVRFFNKALSVAEILELYNLR